MSPQRQIPQEQRPLLVVLGDIGDPSRLTAIKAGRLTVGDVDLRVVAPESIAALTPAEVGRMLAETGAWAACLGRGLSHHSRIDIATHSLELLPGLEFILMEDASPDTWSRASRAGIREVIAPTASDEEFTNAVDAALTRVLRLQELVAQRAQDAARTARVIVILSPKGGSGKTTVSTNLAAALAAAHPDRVALIDFDCQFGDVATSLGLEPERTLTELGQVRDLDASTIKLFLTRHNESSLYVLPSSGRPDEADLIDEAKATRILELLSSEFDYLVVDTAAGIDEPSLAAMNMASDLLFVASMDVTSIRNLSKELEILDHLDLPGHTRRFVINRVDSRSGLKTSEIEASLGMQAAELLDNDPLVLTRLNQGRVIVVSDPRSALAKKFVSLAELYRPKEERTRRSGLRLFSGRKK